MTPDPRNDAIHHYFELAAQPDLDAYFAQFSVDAVVEDEGRERHGIDEIRAWRTEVPAVRYDVRSVVAAGSGLDAVAEISGAFPGSPVDLRFHFEIDDTGLIRQLSITNP